MPSWLDSWTKVRSLTQQEQAKRWATRNDPLPVETKEMRPLRPDEAIPIEFYDPAKQAAFEAYAKKYRYILRVPVDYDPWTYPRS